MYEEGTYLDEDDGKWKSIKELGPYDYESIMQYPFGCGTDESHDIKNNARTQEYSNLSQDNSVKTFSAGDIRGLNMLYNPKFINHIGIW